MKLSKKKEEDKEIEQTRISSDHRRKGEFGWVSLALLSRAGEYQLVQPRTWVLCADCAQSYYLEFMLGFEPGFPLSVEIISYVLINSRTVL